jgi:hypothetical protein
MKKWIKAIALACLLAAWTYGASKAQTSGGSGGTWAGLQGINQGFGAGVSNTLGTVSNSLGAASNTIGSAISNAFGATSNIGGAFGSGLGGTNTGTGFGGTNRVPGMATNSPNSRPF